MKEVTVSTYRKDKYYTRVAQAVARILIRSDVVAPVEVLLEMGNLSKKNRDAWLAGLVPYLERVFEGSLSKANRILRIIGFHAHDLSMMPMQVKYRPTGSRTGRELTFSKSGVKRLEEAYSRHYKWNQSQEKKRKVIEDALHGPSAPGDAEEAPRR